MIPEPQKVQHQEHQIENDILITLIKYLEKTKKRKKMKSKKEKVVIVSGYFDPLHVGHLEYFKMAK